MSQTYTLPDLNRLKARVQSKGEIIPTMFFLVSPFGTPRTLFDYAFFIYGHITLIHNVYL